MKSEGLRILGGIIKKINGGETLRGRGMSGGEIIMLPGWRRRPWPWTDAGVVRQRATL